MNNKILRAKGLIMYIWVSNAFQSGMYQAKLIIVLNYFCKSKLITYSFVHLFLFMELGHCSEKYPHKLFVYRAKKNIMKVEKDKSFVSC